MESTRREMPVIPPAEAVTSACVPVPENSCFGRAAAENSLAAPVGAERPTSSPACARDARDRADVAPCADWRTGDWQPHVDHHKGRELPFTLRISYAPYQGARGKNRRSVTSTAMGHGKGAYATKEAAEQAKAEFKAWVNTEMNKPKRVAAAASAAVRATAPTYPPLPTRFSRRSGTTVYVDSVVLTLRVGDDAHVSAKLDAQPDVAALEESWRARSVNWRAVARKRRAENLEEHAAATRARMPESRYKLFLQRCRDMHAGAEKWAGSVARQMRRRGKARGGLVGQRSEHSVLHRRERRAQQLQQMHRQHRADSVARGRAIERLMAAIRTCDVASLLKRARTGDGAPAAEAVSAKQAVRLTMQSQAVAEMLSEENRLEEAVLNGCVHTLRRLSRARLAVPTVSPPRLVGRSVRRRVASCGGRQPWPSKRSASTRLVSARRACARGGTTTRRARTRRRSAASRRTGAESGPASCSSTRKISKSSSASG